jgi:hypothetical protein
MFDCFAKLKSMPRILFVHWNAEEAKALAAPLRASYEVLIVDAAGQTYGTVAQYPPDAAVISLDRVPSHGLGIASVLRSRKASRHTPLIFVGGAPDKVAGVRKTLPDALYTSWEELPGLLPRALTHRVESPVTPPTSISRPDAPLSKKLGILENSQVVTLNSPPSFERSLGPLPEGASLEEDGAGPADLLILFSESEADLARDFGTAVRRLGPKGKLWLAWPKKSGRVRSDLDMTVVRAFAMSRGWVDYKVCALNTTWSASVFGRRRS